jgi:hypothetical protein
MNAYAEVRTMAMMTMPDLKARYAELFGEQTRSGNRDYLVRRIAWRIQADAEGGLPERARQQREPSRRARPTPMRSFTNPARDQERTPMDTRR